MKKYTFPFVLVLIVALTPIRASSEPIDVLIKGLDDGVKTNRQQDYKEAVMNAKIEAMDRAGVEVASITKVINFKTKFDMVGNKAKAVFLPGFQIMDLGYQIDGTYLVILSGKIQDGKKKERIPNKKILGSPGELRRYMFDAVKDEDYRTVERLLGQGVYVNIKNEDGQTPLHFASGRGDTNIVKVLLKNNANVSAKNNNGEIPLHFASNAQVAKLLLNKTSNPNMQNFSIGATPLFLATQRGHIDAVETLLQKKANPNITNKYKQTPLLIASKDGHKDIVQLLLKYNADAKIRDFQGLTALYYAVEANHVDIAQILCDKGAPLQDYFMAVPVFILNPSIAPTVYKKRYIHSIKVDLVTYPEHVYFRSQGKTEWLERGSQHPHKKSQNGRFGWEVKNSKLIISWYTTYKLDNKIERKYAGAAVFPLDGKIKKEYSGWKFEFRQFKVREFSFEGIANRFQFKEMESPETKDIKGEYCTLTPRY